jgi:phosphatidylglycerophosphate synthase
VERRPISTRDANWAKNLAAGLARSGVTPNMISVASVFFAIVGGIGFLKQNYILAIIGIQMRLVCNLMDGMVAMEHAKRSAVGDLYNDIPDRLADVILIVTAGHLLKDLSWGSELIWTNATLAVFTAYLRVLGGAISLPQKFLGPMAKPHRMALLTTYALIMIFYFNIFVVWSIQIFMCLGLVITCIRRTSDMGKQLCAR